MLRKKGEPDTFRAVPDACHSRWCEPCAAARGRVVRSRLNAYLAGGDYRHLTLTIRSVQADLEVQVNRLYRCFKRLRQRPWWKDRVRGGCAFFECTWNPDTRLYHPHLHVLLDSRYLDLRTIIADWLDITGDSRSVRIRLIRGKAGCIRYVTKYVTKPLDPSVAEDHEAAVGLIRGLRGRRLIVTFGSWRKWKLTSDEQAEDWELYDHAAAMVHNAACGDPLAKLVLSAWASLLDPTEAVIVALPRPPPHSEES